MARWWSTGRGRSWRPIPPAGSPAYWPRRGCGCDHGTAAVALPGLAGDVAADPGQPTPIRARRTVLDAVLGGATAHRTVTESAVRHPEPGVRSGAVRGTVAVRGDGGGRGAVERLLPAGAQHLDVLDGGGRDHPA